MTHVAALCEQMQWGGHATGWIGDPGQVLNALARDGYEACRSEITSSTVRRMPLGGVWQGLNPCTGSVASVVWLRREQCRDAVIIIAIDGERMHGAPPLTLYAA